MLPDAVVALVVWPLGLWLVQSLRWPDALEEDAGGYPVLGIQRDLGKDSQLAAQEIVRRAERGIWAVNQEGPGSWCDLSIADTRIGNRDAIPNKNGPWTSTQARSYGDWAEWPTYEDGGHPGMVGWGRSVLVTRRKVWELASCARLSTAALWRSSG